MSDISIDTLNNKVNDGIKRIFNEHGVFSEYLKTLARFPRYDVRNSVLINEQQLQNRPITELGDFEAWKTKGRHVKWAEKGIQIMSMVKNRPTVVTVFDVAQTSGKAAAKPAADKRDTQNLLFRQTIEGVLDLWSGENSPLQAYLSKEPQARELELGAAFQAVRTYYAIDGGEEKTAKDAPGTEAATADTAAPTIDTLVLEWARDKDLTALTTVLENVRRAANDIIEDSNGKIRAIERENPLAFAETAATAPYNALAAAEMSDEDNYNMIDGIPNNTTPKAKNEPPPPPKIYQPAYDDYTTDRYITVYNAAEETNGSYVLLARITPDGAVSVLDMETPEDALALIYDFAHTRFAAEITAEQREDAFLNGPAPMFAIYQINEEKENISDLLFASTAELARLGKEPEKENYAIVHAAELNAREVSEIMDKGENVAVERIHHDFGNSNQQRQNGFEGRSVTISDVIALQIGGAVTSFYIDSASYSKLEKFTGREKPVEKNVEEKAKPTEEKTEKTAKTDKPKKTGRREKPKPQAKNAKGQPSILKRLEINKAIIKARDQAQGAVGQTAPPPSVDMDIIRRKNGE